MYPIIISLIWLPFKFENSKMLKNQKNKKNVWGILLFKQKERQLNTGGNYPNLKLSMKATFIVNKNYFQ